jgi:RNase P subunit RPR2
MSYKNQLLTVEDVKRVACPRCGAAAGADCEGKIDSNHQDRVRVARQERWRARVRKDAAK